MQASLRFTIILALLGFVMMAVQAGLTACDYGVEEPEWLEPEEPNAPFIKRSPCAPTF